MFSGRLKRILILPSEFYDYKMSKGDTINHHIDKICEIA
jgi:hypothetical protein